MSQEKRSSDLSQLRDVLLDRGDPDAPAPEEIRSSPRFGSLPPKAPLDPKDPLLLRVAPLLELLFLIQKSAGEFGEQEEAVLRGVAKTLNSDLENSQITVLVELFARGLEREGLEGRLGTVTAALSVDRVSAESAYTLAFTVATANGDVSPRELEVLREVAAQLGVSPKRASELSGRPEAL